jgi:hypothetical protein
MEWFTKPIEYPLWQVLLIGCYVFVMHLYITYKLSHEIKSLVFRLRKLISIAFPYHVNQKQNQRIYDKTDDTYNNSNNCLRHAKGLENTPKDTNSLIIKWSH